MVNPPPDVDLELPEDAATASPHDSDVVVVFLRNRNELDEVGAPGVQAVRQISIGDIWSALTFRPA